MEIEERTGLILFFLPLHQLVVVAAVVTIMLVVQRVDRAALAHILGLLDQELPIKVMLAATEIMVVAQLITLVEAVVLVEQAVLLAQPVLVLREDRGLRLL